MPNILEQLIDVDQYLMVSKVRQRLLENEQ
jgi:hypothetical protein